MKRNLLTAAALLLMGTAAAATGGTVFDPPIMGWSSWNTYRVNISDSLIRTQADALVRLGLKELGYTYVNIDDGFFGHRDAAGVMQPHAGRFPDGMKCVADYIHALGLNAGIYSDAGRNTCGSMWDNDANGVGAGLYGHEYQDAALYFRDWGFDFIKIDYCGAGQELNLEEERRYGEIRRAIDIVAGDHVSINICRWAFPGTWARRMAASWRISPDIAPTWEAVKRCIAMNLYLSAYAGEGHYNDMDMLEIGRGLTPDEEETHFGMWCIMSSPLLIGCDLTSIPEPSLRLLKNPELIALNQDPLGLQARVVWHEGAGYVLAKDIVTRRGKVRAVALYNPSDSCCRFSVPTEALELGGRVRLRDLVRRCDLPAVRDRLEFSVAPHGVLILRAEGEERLEPTRYEAEWAYLPCHNALGKDARTVAPVPVEGASGGMAVRYLGGRDENHAEWRDVYSREGGRYELTLRYMPHSGREIELEVNRGPRILLDASRLEPAPGATEGFAEVTLPVTLRPGWNVVRLGNRYGWTPDIDCFTLRCVGSSDGQP